jgi:hypothetical protein
VVQGDNKVFNHPKEYEARPHNTQKKKERKRWELTLFFFSFSWLEVSTEEAAVKMAASV